MNIERITEFKSGDITHYGFDAFGENAVVNKAIVYWTTYIRIKDDYIAIEVEVDKVAFSGECDDDFGNAYEVDFEDEFKPATFITRVSEGLHIDIEMIDLDWEDKSIGLAI